MCPLQRVSNSRRKEEEHTRSHEPCVSSTFQNASDDIFDDVEVRPPEEDRMSARPGVRVNNQSRDMDIVIEGTALFASGDH
jgi:hypothetical protein